MRRYICEPHLHLFTRTNWENSRIQTSENIRHIDIGLYSTVRRTIFLMKSILVSVFLIFSFSSCFSNNRILKMNAPNQIKCITQIIMSQTNRRGMMEATIVVWWTIDTGNYIFTWVNKVIHFCDRNTKRFDDDAPPTHSQLDFSALSNFRNC